MSLRTGIEAMCKQFQQRLIDSGSTDVVKFDFVKSKSNSPGAMIYVVRIFINSRVVFRETHLTTDANPNVAKIEHELMSRLLLSIFSSGVSAQWSITKST